ncbi:uncharacterized protein LOC111899795 [Lactuca sativa]|uniref:uncharacterized protein LOC111899795 n=1 Tax=Lactuca sativa TaxID=4236 RepID=UPI0022AE6FDD|nr:uncharacterized protein LOC111899795 [Lactuca sativa]
MKMKQVASHHILFALSKYTGRIHLYSCIQRVETRPTPLFKDFKPEELETKDPDNLDDSIYKPALIKFLKEWNSLRPIEQRKLYSKPLQLPLSVESCLMEIQNHDKEMSSVTDHASAQDTGAKAAYFDDDDDGGGLALNAQSRAMLMENLITVVLP